MSGMVTSIGVRRFAEHGMTTPVVLSGRDSCGTFSDHVRLGRIAIAVEKNGRSWVLHLTTDDALRLSDLLRAMADTNAEAGR